MPVSDADGIVSQTAGHDIDLHDLLLQLVDAAGGVYRRIGVANWLIKKSTRARQEDVFLYPDAECELSCVAFDNGFSAIEVV